AKLHVGVSAADWRHDHSGICGALRVHPEPGGLGCADVGLQRRLGPRWKRRDCRAGLHRRRGLIRHHGSALYPELVKDDVLKFLRGLRAVREYTAETVDDHALNEILEVGRWTSTGGNRQPTEVVVVRDGSVLQKFANWGARPAGSAAVSLLLVSASEQSGFDEGRMAERLALA